MIKELRLEVNKNCNYSCVHCYTDKREHDWLSLERIRKLITETAAAGGTDLSLTGGEPLIEWERVRDIAMTAKQAGLAVRINTNGHLLSDKIVDALTPVIDEFQVSLNGASAEFFDWFVQRPGGFDKVIAGIHRLRERGARISIRFTLMEETAPHLVPTFKLCKTLDVSSFKVRAVVPAGEIAPNDSKRAVIAMTRASHDLFRAVDGSNIEVRFNDGGMGIAVPEGIQNLHYMPCMCGADALFVAADGSVAPCVFLRDHHGYQVGDASRQSLSDIIVSDVLRDFIGHKADHCGNERHNGCRAADLWRDAWQSDTPPPLDRKPQTLVPLRLGAADTEKR
jgi:MoaA/NifB/PqqE/SkfB family radical SAM enzyme